MHLTTYFPDGRRDVYAPGPDEPPEQCRWALVVRGRPDLGHRFPAQWTVHRYTTTQQEGLAVAGDLEHVLAVEEAVVVPTEAHELGPWWTGIGFWNDDDSLSLVGIAPGQLDVSEGQDVSVGGPWTTTVRAGDRATARDRIYLAMAEAEDAQHAEDARTAEGARGGHPGPGHRQNSP